MSTQWYQGSDGIEYPIETDDRERDQEDQPTELRIELELWRVMHKLQQVVANERIGCADLPINWLSVFAQVDTLRRDLEALRDHRCQWSSNDYCMVCGADGRA